MNNMNFQEYTDYQRVKYMIFAGKDEVERIIYENADLFEESVFSIKHLEILKQLIIDNNDIINTKRKREIEKLTTFFKDNITFYSKIDKKKYEWKCYEVLRELSKQKFNDNYKFYLNEFKIRTDNLYPKFSKLVESKLFRADYINIIEESILRDATYVQVLDNEGYQVDDYMINNLNFMWSLNSFYHEQPHLLRDEIIRKKINYIMFKNKDLILNDKQANEFISNEACNKILKKINK